MNSALPLYRADEVRALDRHAIETLGIPGLVLMQRAGAAVFDVLRRQWSDAASITVLCGAGNNAGDGYVVGTLALAAGLPVSLYALTAPDRLKGDAQSAYRQFLAAGGVATPGLPDRFAPDSVLVDALLGTGLDRPVQGVYAEAIAAVNACGNPVLALDIPSGLCADSGMPLGDRLAVRASCTVTFIALKQGLYTGLAADYCGALHLADLAVPMDAATVIGPQATLLGEFPRLPKRARCVHKGHHGHVLVIGGDSGYSGAARMAAEAAARCGAGLVSIATRAAHADVINLGRPELMVHGVESADALQGLLEKAGVVVIGPGLGQSDWAKTLFAAVLASALPLVVDADALNLLAAAPRRRDNWVLTPHPGEAGRLLGTGSAAVQQNRYAALDELRARYGGVVVLKGPGSLIGGAHGPAYVCTAGNPGMAGGGMGDVLAGIIAALIAQGVAPLEAAAGGAVLHGTAADVAAERGERGLLAGDLFNPLRELINR
ncbi:MAG: NAD(P)H-hydrate dehydratase [Methylococcaceae bacterium]|nr:MAG: NAD(P)H-hydrate dehydratase [Methylococcaceae bacterium]